MRKFLLFMLVILSAFTCESYAYDSADIYGEMKDGRYTNKVLGAEAYFGKGWNIISREELSIQMGKAAGSSSFLGKLKDAAETSLIFIASDKKGTLGIIIGFAEIKTESSDKFAENVINGINKNSPKLFSEMGITDYSCENITADFLDSECPGVMVVLTRGNAVLYQKEIVYITGRYCFVLNASSLNYDETDKILSMFQKISVKAE